MVKLRQEFLEWEAKCEKIKKALLKNEEGQEPSEEEVKKNEEFMNNTPKEWENLKHFDFVQPLDLLNKKSGEHQLDYIVEYNEKETSLFDIFQEYGTSYRPPEDKKKDPLPPPPKEKVATPPPKKEPTPQKKVEDDEEALVDAENIDKALES